MKQFVISLLICLTLQVTAAEYLYLASGDTLKVHVIDAKSGKLKEIQSAGLPGAGPFTFSPDKSKLYIVAKKLNGTKKGAMAIATFPN